MESPVMRRVVVTGVNGLLGWHAAVRLHAANCAARFAGRPQPWDIVGLDHAGFESDAILAEALSGAASVLHFAGVNRATDNEVETGNPAIAARLAAACRKAGELPHVVYANSTHADRDSPYGRGKRRAAEVLEDAGLPLTDLVLPHIFGEGARPFYNNVTATLIAQLIAEESPTVDPQGKVALLYAGEAADTAIEAAEKRVTGQLRPQGRKSMVQDLLDRIAWLHGSYTANVIPDLSDSFDLALFNAYRAALYPDGFPRLLKQNTDPRGTLYEAVKGRSGGQTFLSWTEEGVTRGDHFHLGKVERFVVLKGEAIIRIRRVLGGPVWEYRVSGDTPAAVDMPTMHTHSIENVGNSRLLTLFWTNEIFDPANPDTYSDPVLEN